MYERIYKTILGCAMDVRIGICIDAHHLCPTFVTQALFDLRHGSPFGSSYMIQHESPHCLMKKYM
jgi:hypothetical protein